MIPRPSFPVPKMERAEGESNPALLAWTGSAQSL